MVTIWRRGKTSEARLVSIDLLFLSTQTTLFMGHEWHTCNSSMYQHQEQNRIQGTAKDNVRSTPAISAHTGLRTTYVLSTYCHGIHQASVLLPCTYFNTNVHKSTTSQSLTLQPQERNTFDPKMSSTTTSTDPPSQTPINLTLTPQELQTLSTLAIGAKRKAYCPYSNFRVGAALIIDIDTPGQADAHLPAFHTGANVEVASTPVGTCAERCALAPVVASLERPRMPRVRAMAVSTDIWPPSSPCGMCR